MYTPHTAPGCLLLLALTCCPPAAAGAEVAWKFGFGKADITPAEPLRLSGYGNRTEPFTAVDESLYVRAVALQAGSQAPHVLVSCDTIGLPGTLVETIARDVEQEHGLPRAALVVCFTHSHTSPHIAGGLTNIFAKPLTADERNGAQAYTDRLAQQMKRAIRDALSSRETGTLEFRQGQVTFAENRRVLRDDRWVGFGVNPAGPVDHTLPVLTIKGSDGSVRGLIFNYACHCTTFDSNHNQVNGDWAGYAAQYLESAYPGACAICTIGCGADANPPRDRSRAMELAQAEGKMILDEIERLLATAAQPITAPLTARFGHAALPFELPSVEALQQQLHDGNVQVRAHAQNMLAIHQRDGALPKSYPAPLQVWRFGDQLTMLFLSGEVVVDYALRLKRELGPGHVWVSGYANDLFAYVASQRIRQEGGYEVDRSMIYYNQPGPWADGTEELLVQRVHALAANEVTVRK